MQPKVILEVIAITGTKASGKGVLTKAYIDEGFRMVRYSDIIRVEMLERLNENNPTTPAMQLYSNLRKRETDDGGYWTPLVLARAQELGVARLVLDGIRNPGEIEALKRVLDPLGIPWDLVVTDGPYELRERLYLLREQAGDILTPEAFRELDEIDRGRGQDKYGQRVDDCMALVPREKWLVNDGTKEQWDEKCRLAAVHRATKRAA